MGEELIDQNRERFRYGNRGGAQADLHFGRCEVEVADLQRDDLDQRLGIEQQQEPCDALAQGGDVTGHQCVDPGEALFVSQRRRVERCPTSDVDIRVDPCRAASHDERSDRIPGG